MKCSLCDGTGFRKTRSIYLNCEFIDECDEYEQYSICEICKGTGVLNEDEDENSYEYKDSK